jgi:hypothetical protein
MRERDPRHRESSIVRIIGLLASEAASHLKFLVTSRPEPNLIQDFKSRIVRPIHEMLDLCNIEVSIVEGDLRLYIRARMEDQALECEGSEAVTGWPIDHEVEDIVNLSGQLFIVATTILRILEFPLEDEYPNPRAALRRLLKSESGTLGLDGTYREVLRMTAHCHQSPKQRSYIRLLLSFVVLSFEPLAATEIDELLGIRCEAFLPVLSYPFCVQSSMFQKTTLLCAQFTPRFTTSLSTHSDATRMISATSTP